MNEHFPGKKRRSVSAVIPPNILKNKTGIGGIDPALVEAGQLAINNNTLDIAQVIDDMLLIITDVSRKARSKDMSGEEAIQGLIHPVAQLKAHGSMFNYPSVTKISHIMLDFLETVPELDNDVLDVITGFKLSVKTVSRGQKNTSKESKEICEGLLDACSRYHKKKGL